MGLFSLRMREGGTCRGCGLYQCASQQMMTLATLFLISLVSLGTAELPLDVVTPSGYTKLRSWANCSLYRIEAETTYDYAPLLIHLPGSRYGEWLTFFMSVNCVSSSSYGRFIKLNLDL